MGQMGVYQTANYNAAIYCRLSKDDEQAGESVSIQTQKLMLEILSGAGLPHLWCICGRRVFRPKL